jgi:hypothetical protein
MQPGAQRSLSLQISRPPRQDDEHRLRHILRQVMSPRAPQGGGEDHVGVLGGQAREGFLGAAVAGVGVQQVPVVHLRHVP